MGEIQFIHEKSGGQRVYRSVCDGFEAVEQNLRVQNLRRGIHLRSDHLRHQKYDSSRSFTENGGANDWKICQLDEVSADSSRVLRNGAFPAQGRLVWTQWAGGAAPGCVRRGAEQAAREQLELAAGVTSCVRSRTQHRNLVLARSDLMWLKIYMPILKNNKYILPQSFSQVFSGDTLAFMCVSELEISSLISPINSPKDFMDILK